MILKITNRTIRLIAAWTLVFGLTDYLSTISNLFELTSHFKVQYLIVSAICSLIFLRIRDYRWAAVGLITVSLNAALVLPIYWKDRPVNTISDGSRLRIVHSNVLYSNNNYNSFLEMVEEESPDILIVQEFTSGWFTQIKILSNRFPFYKAVPLEKGAGIALFSRIPLKEAKIVDLVGEDRPAIAIKVDLSGTELSLLTLHPYTPILNENFLHRNRQLSAASSLIKELPSPKVLIGDFNITHWSPFFSRMEQETGLINARDGFGTLPTWPTFNLISPLMIPIDHCLVSSDIDVVNIKTGRHIGSDHLPLVVDLIIPKR
jgi:endonuclease/exonuclease/phosphatase (EEP) superfamily protein YafD